MLPSQSNLKNRRSISVLTELNSKRSSLSILNIHDSILNSNHHNELSFLPHSKPNQLLFSLSNELVTIKNHFIKSYKLVKKKFKDQSKSRDDSNHSKDETMELNKADLEFVYRGLSNGLKSLENVNEIAQNLKKQLLKSQPPINQFTSSYKLPHTLSDQTLKNAHPLNQPGLISQFQSRIQNLEQEIQTNKEKHSQQIRLMIQNHEEEMMFVEQQHTQKINSIKKYSQQQIQTLTQTHKKKDQETKIQTTKKINELMKKLQDLAKFQPLLKDKQEKQTSYKTTIKNLLQKLSQARSTSQNLAKQLQANIFKTKTIVQKLTKPHQPKSDSYLKILSQKLTNILSQEPPNDDLKQALKKPQISESAPMPYSTMAIEQMFMKSEESLLEGQNIFEVSLQSILEQLVWWGFFCEQNEDNVGNLFSIARHRISDDNMNPSIMLSHTLYPLIVQKIKLTLNRLQPNLPKNLKDSLNPMTIQNPTVVTQFSTEHIKKIQNNIFPVRYRNIESIEELQVSDSMICDDNEDKEKRIVQGGFQNHSPIVNYKGYGTIEKGGDSASFDVDLF